MLNGVIVVNLQLHILKFFNPGCENNTEVSIFSNILPDKLNIFNLFNLLILGIYTN